VIRLSEAEKLVKQGAELSEIIIAAEKVIKPIDDQRSTAVYRKQIAINCLKEFLQNLLEEK